MKVLSLLQPWASMTMTRYDNLTLKVSGPAVKEWETRSWKPSDSMLRRIRQEGILIHASAAWNKRERKQAAQHPFNTYLDGIKPETGAIIGWVSIGEIITTEEWVRRYMDIFRGKITGKSKMEYLVGDYTGGRYAWHMPYYKPFREPIPAKGALSLWDYPAVSPQDIKNLSL